MNGKNYLKPNKDSKDLFWPALIIFIVGIHSILLGLIIFFFTDFFYKVFFDTAIENLFFVRQSGIFLFLIGLFYLFPLLNLKNLYNLILLVIISKTVAVLFLIMNGQLTPAPAMIYLAAFFDGLMGAVLSLVYLQCRRVYARPKPEIIPAEETRLKEVA